MIIARGALALPFQQGELDGLCGVYAIVNAIRLALGNRVREFTTEHWQHLFAELLATADDQVGAVRTVVSGLDTKPLVKLLTTAVRHMADEHELTMSFRRVLQRGERPPINATLERLNDVARQPGSAVIVALRSHLDHWSVLHSVGERYLLLFDSSRFPRVKVASCRMSYEPRRPAGREHVLHPGDLFSLQMTM